ncbi:hypothetical protein ACJJTC_007361 [Scirpophaga incertulas]
MAAPPNSKRNLEITSCDYIRKISRKKCSMTKETCSGAAARRVAVGWPPPPSPSYLSQYGGQRLRRDVVLSAPTAARFDLAILTVLITLEGAKGFLVFGRLALGFRFFLSVPTFVHPQ